MKSNISIYIVAFLLSILLILAFLDLQSDSIVFYGFTINKETTINLDRDAYVKKTYAHQGQVIHKGDTLYSLNNEQLFLKENELNVDDQSLSHNIKIKKLSLIQGLNSINADRALDSTDIFNDIKLINNQITENNLTIEKLPSLAIDSKNINQKLKENISTKENVWQSKKQMFQTEINSIKKMLSIIENPISIRSDLSSSQKELQSKEQQKLIILAPEDGIVGEIFAKAGNYIPAYNKYMNLSSKSPIYVKAYILESLNISFEINDDVIIKQINDTSIETEGKIINIGSRITEIPARLRKNQDFMTYGKEILIEISPVNKFLQNEKVMLVFQKK